jgi:hypothetical protein
MTIAAPTAGGIVLHSGDELVEGKGDFGEFIEEFFGDLAVRLEDCQLLADEVLVLEFQAVFRVLVHSQSPCVLCDESVRSRVRK